MDLEIIMNNETQNPKDGYSGVDLQVRNANTNENIPEVCALAFSLDIEDIAPTVEMHILFSSCNFKVLGGNDGVPTVIRFEDDPDKVIEMPIRIVWPKTKIEVASDDMTRDDKNSRLTAVYSVADATQIKLYDARNGDRLVNIRKWSFAAAVDDLVVKAEAIASGDRLIRETYGIGSPDPIRIV